MISLKTKLLCKVIHCRRVVAKQICYSTPFNRGRGWIRLALMEKKLADYFAALADKPEALAYVHCYIGRASVCHFDHSTQGLKKEESFNT